MTDRFRDHLARRHGDGTRPSRARLFGWAAALCAGTGLVAALAHGLNGDTVAPDGGPAAAARVPELSGRTLDGSDFSLARLRGHRVLVTLWASWCERCRGELPALVRSASRLRAEGVRVVGVNVRDGAAAARRHVLAAGAEAFPQLPDPGGRLALELGARGLPETFLIDRNGVIVRRLAGGLTHRWLDRHVFT
ncbi:TlpA family protein disulfide reductase [Nonomuraea sp. NN258]|uniref:TlpA family protein disulfide reductase n=1 Tax=Nonomuraea antri TaxID=2730852 RepID=UPI001569371B|nr:TlpA disulfide reductase family protein [Nonomuraea antri]NRQ38944.1 TlpA family protein disulfide reductase [Nonomuraea antri]